MSRIKTTFSTVARWGWFIVLVGCTFGFLVAGLSRGGSKRQAAVKAVPPSEANAAANLGESSAAQFSASALPPARRSGTRTTDFRDSVRTVNERWQQQLDAQGLASAPAADWLAICRRMSLATVGSGLSLEEIRHLQRLPVDQREDAHIESLLNDSRFHDYWAERWTRFLVGTDEGAFIVFRRRRFKTWLSDQFAANRPYDHLVSDLITAEGLWTDRPEVNFFTATYDSGDNEPDPIRLAAKTSRAFLGLRIDCLQCHDDFLGNVSLGSVEDTREGLQSDFHQLAAFFTSAKNDGFKGLKGLYNGKSDYEYQYLGESELVDVTPAVPYASELLPTEGHDRVRLAKWITHPENDQAARTAVNHVWALLFGKPLGEAVDNLPLDETVSPVLAELADDFVEHDFDVRRLIRLIVRSAPFRVDGKADFDITPQHESIGAVFPLVRLRPEQVAGSTIQAGRVRTLDRESALFEQLMKFGNSGDFVRRYGDIGDDEFASESVTITQRLIMLNGKMVSEHSESNPVLHSGTHIRMFSPDDSTTIENIYLAVLNRLPSDAERSRFSDRLTSGNNKNNVIEDLYWVLMNSSEFAWNH